MLDFYTSPAEQHDTLINGDVLVIIDWLCWNDPDGLHDDAERAREGLEPYTLSEARAAMRAQMEE